MDKKLKNAGEKITMPEDMKERIIKACENTTEKNIIRTDTDDGYTDVVSSTERIDPRKNILRTVSTIAACAVLAAGVGTTGFLLHRNHTSNLAENDAIDEEPVEKTCPFGDFGKYNYTFVGVDGNDVLYYKPLYTKLTEFLNNFDWGERHEPEDEEEAADELIDCEVYRIHWEYEEDGTNHYCSLEINGNGKAYFLDALPPGDDLDGHSEFVDEHWREIDFNAFDSGIKDIMENYGTAVSPFVDFRTVDFNFQAGIAMYDGYNSPKIYDVLANMLNNFDWGEGVDEPAPEEGVLNFSDSVYSISWEEDHVISWVNIESTGRTEYVVLKYADDYLEAEEIARRIYQIDLEDFDYQISMILLQIDENIGQDEIDWLTRGECEKVVLRNSENGEVNPDDANVKKELDAFLKDRFFRMLKTDIPSATYDYNLALCEITYDYKMDDNITRIMYFSILDNGVVSMSEYMVTDGNKEPSGAKNYGINIQEFKDRLADKGYDIDSNTLYESDISERITKDEKNPSGKKSSGDVISPFGNDDEIIYDANGEYDPVANMQRIDQNIQNYVDSFPDASIRVHFEDEDGNELVPADEQTRDKIENFIRNDFESMLEYGRFADYSSPYEGKNYAVIYEYMSGDREIYFKAYNVVPYNSAIRSDCWKKENGGEQWRGPFAPYIDYNAFVSKLAEFGLI